MSSPRRKTLAAMTRPRKSIGIISKNNESNVQADHKTKTESSTERARDRKSMMPRVPGEMASPLLKRNLSNGGRSANETTPSRRKSLEKRQALARNDPRPISDKEYQLTCIKNLLQYLTENGYENTVNMRSLSRPSGKDFNQILTFLLRKIDPKFNDGSIKFEEEVVLVFRHSNYPFTMSKTSLVAAGSPHTWSTLLAALTWLVDYLKMHYLSENVDDSIPGTENEADISHILHKSEKDFFRYLGKSYKAFLNADDSFSNELKEQYVERFEEDSVAIEQKLIKEKQQNEAIAIEIESLESLAVPADSRNKMEQLCAKLESFEQLHSQLLERKETLQQRVTSRTQELQKMEKQVSKNKSNIGKLKKSRKNQNLSQEDIKRMKNEISQLRDTLDRTAASKTKIQKLACEHDERFHLKINELKQQVKQCNATTEWCQQMLPLNYAQRNKKFFLYVDSAQAHNYKTDPSKLFSGVNLKQYAIPTFLKMREDFCNRIDENKQMLVKLVNQTQSTEISIIDESEKSKIASNKLQSVQEMVQREETSNESELSSLLNEVRNIEDKIKTSANSSTFSATIAKYQIQLTEKENERRRMHKEAAAVKESINEEIQHALTVAANHKEYIQNEFANLVSDLEGKIRLMNKVEEDRS